jgi:hypothetical protein
MVSLHFMVQLPQITCCILHQFMTFMMCFTLIYNILYAFYDNLMRKYIWATLAVTKQIDILR